MPAGCFAPFATLFTAASVLRARMLTAGEWNNRIDLGAKGRVGVSIAQGVPAARSVIIHAR